MKKNGLKYVLYVAGTVLLIVLDRLSKVWAAANLKGQPAIEIWPGVFELRYLENNGMAFGLMQNMQIFFYIMTVLILAAVVYMLYRTPFEKRYTLMLIVLTFMTGGAIGNLIDRATTKYVVDFLYFKLINFPIFNVADIFVTLSAIALFILLLFVYKDEEISRLYAPKRKKIGEEEA